MAKDEREATYELFTMRNGEPIQFSVPICPEKEELRKVIELYGGTVTSMTGGHHTIRLIPPGLRVAVSKGYDNFSTSFVEDSLKNKRLLDLNSYRVGKSQFTKKINVNDILLGTSSWTECEYIAEDSGEEVSDFDDDKPPQLQKNSFKPSRRDYSYKEKMAILQYIIKKRRYKEVKGRALWQEMEARKVCEGRTWGSMKEHFRKAIMNNLHLFKLSDEEKRRLSSPYALYVGAKKFSAVSDEESSDDSDVDEDTLRKERKRNDQINIEDRSKSLKTPQKNAEPRKSELGFEKLFGREEHRKQKLHINIGTSEKEKNKTASDDNRRVSEMSTDHIKKNLVRHEVDCNAGRSMVEKESYEVINDLAGPSTSTGTEAARPSKVSDTETAGPSKVSDAKIVRPSKVSGTEDPGLLKVGDTETVGLSKVCGTKAIVPSKVSGVEVVGPSKVNDTETAGPSKGCGSEAAEPIKISGADGVGSSKVTGTEAAGPSEITVAEGEKFSEESNDCPVCEQPESMLPGLCLPDIVCSAPLPPLYNSEGFDAVLTSQEFPVYSEELYFPDKKKAKRISSDAVCNKLDSFPSCSKESVKVPEKSAQSQSKTLKYSSQTGSKTDLNTDETSANRDIDDMHSQMFASVACTEESSSNQSVSNINDKPSERSKDPLTNNINDSLANAVMEREQERNVASESAKQLVNRLANEWDDDSDSSCKSSSGSSTIIFELTRTHKPVEEVQKQPPVHKNRCSCNADETCISESDEVKGHSEGENYMKRKLKRTKTKVTHIENKNMVLSDKLVQQCQEENDGSSDSTSESDNVSYDLDSEEEPITLRRDTRMRLTKSQVRSELQRDESVYAQEQSENKVNNERQEKKRSRVLKYIDDSPADSSDTESETESVISNYHLSRNFSDPVWNRDNFSGRYDRPYYPHNGCGVGSKQKTSDGSKKRQNIPYTIQEDIAILEYIIENKAYGRLGGREFWQGMEQHLLPKRSWHSLKERFRKRIAHRLPTYVEHGISEGRLRRLNRAIKLPKEEPSIKDDEGDGHWKPYSRGEDQAIVQFIIKNKRHAEVGGRTMWALMSRKVHILRGRTWQSLKERFRKRIIRHLEDFDISLDDKRRLLMFGVQGKKVNHNRYFSPRSNRDGSPESSGSDPEEDMGRKNEKMMGKEFPRECTKEIRDTLISDKEKSKRSRQIMETYFSKKSNTASSTSVVSEPTENLVEEMTETVNIVPIKNTKKRKLYSNNEGIVLTLPLPQMQEHELADRDSEDSLPKRHAMESSEIDKSSDQNPAPVENLPELKSSLPDQHCEALNDINTNNNLNIDNAKTGNMGCINNETEAESTVVLENSESPHTCSVLSQTEQSIRTLDSPLPADASSNEQKRASKHSLRDYFQKEQTTPVTRSSASKSSSISHLREGSKPAGTVSRKLRSMKSSGVTPRGKLRVKAVRCFKC